MLLLRESELFQYFVEIGKPLPFSLSTLQKDRLDGRLGVPYRPLGGGIFYAPHDVENWLSGAPKVVPHRQCTTSKNQNLKRGKPLKSESVEAARLGITVRELRLRYQSGKRSSK